MIWTAPHQPTIDELGWFRFTVGRLGGPSGAPVVVSRTGYTGELGFEVFCHPKDGTAVYDAVWAHGDDLGLKPMGLAALDMVRIEAGLIFAGYDFSDQTDPFEAGIGFTVPLKSKTDDFIGREALIRRKEHPVAQVRRAGDRRERRRGPWRLPACRARAGGGGDVLDALAASGQEHRAGAGGCGACRGRARRWRSASWTASRSACRRVIVPLSHYDPKKTRPQS